MRCQMCGAVMQSKVIANRPFKLTLTRFTCVCGHAQTESNTSLENVDDQELETIVRLKQDKLYKPNADESFKEAGQIKEDREFAGDLSFDGDDTWDDPIQPD